MNDGLTYSEFLRGVVPKQYTYTNVSDFIDRKGKFYDSFFNVLEDKLVDEVYNIDTCTRTALRNYWGKLYGIKPFYEDSEGVAHVLNDEEYRIAVKFRAFCSCWDGTTYQLNAFLSKVFKERGVVFASDTGGMEVNYVFFFELPDWELNLYRNYDILPRNAGCGWTVTYASRDVFGFYGSELYPFNQKPFMNYR